MLIIYINNSIFTFKVISFIYLFTFLINSPFFVYYLHCYQIYIYIYFYYGCILFNKK